VTFEQKNYIIIMQL